MKILYQGAESIIYLENNQLIKDRIKKSYRHPSIDIMKRKYPTRKEFKILNKLKSIVNVPATYGVDDKNMKIKMEYLKGDILKDKVAFLSQEKRKNLFIQLGKEVAILHNQNIVHGDLTTSNLILKDDKIYFIDFGLSNFSDKLEDKAVDLRVLRQALESKHYNFPELFQTFLKGYSPNKIKPVIDRLLKTVETRGRYKKKRKLY